MAHLERLYVTGYDKPRCNGHITEQWSFRAYPGQQITLQLTSEKTASYRLTHDEPKNYIEGYVRPEVLH